MSNYIEEFIKRMKDCANGNNCESCPYQYEGLTETETCKGDLLYDAAEEFERLYSRIPSKLVRCKDCLYHTDAYPYDEEDELIPSNAVFCQHFEVIRDKEWFCADGKRKEKDDVKEET